MAMRDEEESMDEMQALHLQYGGNHHFPSLPYAIDADWSYDMRRTMQEVIPGLFIGPYSVAMTSKLDYLLTHGITHIVCVRCTMEARIIRPKFPDRFKYLVLDIADCPTENIIQHFRVVRDFINDCMNSGGKALIHGNAGISRSAALGIAYIMEKYGLTYMKAFNLLQAKRFCVNPNEGFVHQLKAYESIYLADLTCGRSETERSLKRTFDEIDKSMEIMDRTGEMMDTQS